MSAKFTPGPWLVNPFFARVDNGIDSPICELLWPTSLRSEDETEANALLIAAAPNGYALAVAVAAHFEGTDAPLGQMARDFLAKATGPEVAV